MPSSDAERRYGRQGGGWLPKDQGGKAPPCDDHERWWRLNDAAGCVHPDHDAEREARAAAETAGRVVRARCLCAWWWLAPSMVGELCPACEWPMVADEAWRGAA